MQIYDTTQSTHHFHPTILQHTLHKTSHGRGLNRQHHETQPVYTQIVLQHQRRRAQHTSYTCSPSSAKGESCFLVRHYHNTHGQLHTTLHVLFWGGTDVGSRKRATSEYIEPFLHDGSVNSHTRVLLQPCPTRIARRCHHLHCFFFSCFCLMRMRWGCCASSACAG